MSNNIQSPERLAIWKYQKHKAQSKFRKIDFNLTFDEWYNWWLSHGVDKRLDIKWPPKARPCMCRIGDAGAYELGNIYFDTHNKNVKHLHENGKNNSHGKKTALNYRWGSELITLETLQTKYNISGYQNTKYYKVDNYDAYREKEKVRLTKQWNNIPYKLWWQTDVGCYLTLDDAAKCEGISKHILAHRFQNSKRQFINKKNPYQQYTQLRVKISLENYICKNSRFPDPLI